MRVKATISFAGEVCMAQNEVRDVPEDVAAPLLNCGYLVEAVDPPAPEPGSEKKRGKKEA